MSVLSDNAGDSGLGAGRDRRARGEIRAEFARRDAGAYAARLFETGGLRLRFPRSDVECEAVILNTGGGMAGGDRARVALSAREGAEAIVCTQAAEKIYRTDGERTEIEVRLAVDAGASLVWAPQETLIFQGADLRRRLEADVAADGSLLIVESAVFGRLAHGETRIEARFHDDWRVRRAGRLIFAEAVRLESAGADLDRRACGAGARAVATLLWVAPQAAGRLDPLRALFEHEMAAEGAALEAGASALDGFVVARLLSPSPQRLRAALIAAMRLVRGRDTPRVWM